MNSTIGFDLFSRSADQKGLRSRAVDAGCRISDDGEIGWEWIIIELDAGKFLWGARMVKAKLGMTRMSPVKDKSLIHSWMGELESDFGMEPSSQICKERVNKSIEEWKLKHD